MKRMQHLLLVLEHVVNGTLSIHSPYILHHILYFQICLLKSTLYVLFLLNIKQFDIHGFPHHQIQETQNLYILKCYIILVNYNAIILISFLLNLIFFVEIELMKIQSYLGQYRIDASYSQKYFELSYFVSNAISYVNLNQLLA